MTSTKRERRRNYERKSGKGTTSLRSDIQGLRAIAVIAVVLDHLLGWPSGGFVGVDVFFVISGFLITGLLIREHDRTGTISFADFYRRRIRRITPAATVVLIVTVAVSFLIFNTGRALSTLFDSVWAFFFAANWHFAAVGTDYFEAAGPESPLQHFWSLAVEEQFYFVWPVLMFTIFALAGRSAKWDRTRARRAVGVAMIILMSVSFAWAIFETHTSPTWAYFSTFARAWELGVGALIAVFAGSLSRIPQVSRPLIGWVGLVGIAVSLFIISDSLVIIAGTGGKQRFLWPISNPVSGYIGNISYSLYLWHFPVIVLLAAIVPDSTVLYNVLAAGIMVVLAVASYQYVEKGVLNSNFLVKMTPNQKSAAVRVKIHSRRSRSGVSQNALVGMILLAVVASGTSALAYTQSNPGVSDAGPVPSVADFNAESPAQVGDANNPQAVLSAQIDVALGHTEWPELSPSIENLQAAKAPEWDQCLTTERDEIESCTFGQADAPKTAFLLGDSVAISWLPGIREALEPLGYKVVNLTMQQCPTANLEIVATNGNAGGSEIEGFNQDCEAHRSWVLEEAISQTPELVIMSNNLQPLSSGASGSQANEEWSEGYASYMGEFSGVAQKVVMLGLPPVGANLAECRTNINKPADCVVDIPDYWDQAQNAKIDAVTAAGAAGVNATYVDPQLWVCSAAGKCPSFVDGTIVRADSLHLTAEYSRKLALLLAPALDESAATSSAAAGADSPEDQARAEVASSLSTQEWGDLSPSLDFIADSGSPEWLEDDCLNVTTTAKSTDCTYGSGDKTAVLVGDSYAISWLPGLRDALEPQGWEIQLLTLGACPNVNLTVDGSTGVPIVVCDEHHEWIPEQIAAIQPDMIILADKSSFGVQITGQLKGVPQTTLWETGTSDFIKQLLPSTDRMVVIGSPPGSGNLQSCFTPLGGPRGCVKDVDGSNTLALNDAEKKAATAHGIDFIDPVPWLCAQGKCPAVIGTTPVYSDGEHFTQAFSKKLAPLLAASMG
jgi:peptidoglycan/LPS O-acetylase OafA/YrhL